MYTTPTDHLRAELERLDLLLHRQILRLRAEYQLALDEFRGLYISDQQVDRLIHQNPSNETDIPTLDELTERIEEIRRANMQNLHNALPWNRLVNEFGLSQFEQDVLILAIAPQIHLKYETLYAYLNNDVTRRLPTCDLALRLFSSNSADQIRLRKFLHPDGILFRSGLLHMTQTMPEHSSWLAGSFSPHSSVTPFLLGLPFHDADLVHFCSQITPAANWDEAPFSEKLSESLQQALHFFQPRSSYEPAPILVFQGRYGTGREFAAEAFCRDLAVPFYRVELEEARNSSLPFLKIIQTLILQHRLTGAGIFFDGTNALFEKEGNPLPESFQVIRQLARLNGPLFFSTTTSSCWHELLKGQRFILFEFDDSTSYQRLKLWEKYVSNKTNAVPRSTFSALADRFVLTPGQIRNAVTSAADVHRLKHGSDEPLKDETLFEAARAQSNQSLGKLALRVNTIHTWDDLVLPIPTLRQVQEVAAAIEYQNVVYSEWGFEHRITSGKGLKVLFAGASGTGKTMTASVIAKDLGLDLYKVDLSGIVSKYIGETEKNLDRIFRAAHCSNAILFFDEADALFGKRSEVKDAHDRYANIEVAYLLQKMEEHEGVVILASNLSKNIDDAFSRRMHYVVDFPLPDEPYREKLWRGMFPHQVPLSEDVDLRFLAKQFPMSGGDIKNVVLAAAFLAAHDGQEITMKQLIKAVARQFIKQGKLPSPPDFKQYHSLVSQG
jgi:hypothetical protein